MPLELKRKRKCNGNGDKESKKNKINVDNDTSSSERDSGPNKTLPRDNNYSEPPIIQNGSDTESSDNYDTDPDTDSDTDSEFDTALDILVDKAIEELEHKSTAPSSSKQKGYIDDNHDFVVIDLTQLTVEQQIEIKRQKTFQGKRIMSRTNFYKCSLGFVKDDHEFITLNSIHLTDQQKEEVKKKKTLNGVPLTTKSQHRNNKLGFVNDLGQFEVINLNKTTSEQKAELAEKKQFNGKEVIPRSKFINEKLGYLDDQQKFVLINYDKLTPEQIHEMKVKNRFKGKKIGTKPVLYRTMLGLVSPENKFKAIDFSSLTEAQKSEINEKQTLNGIPVIRRDHFYGKKRSGKKLDKTVGPSSSSIGLSNTGPMERSMESSLAKTQLEDAPVECFATPHYIDLTTSSIPKKTSGNLNQEDHHKILLQLIEQRNATLALRDKYKSFVEQHTVSLTTLKADTNQRSNILEQKKIKLNQLLKARKQILQSNQKLPAFATTVLAGLQSQINSRDPQFAETQSQLSKVEEELVNLGISQTRIDIMAKQLAEFEQNLAKIESALLAKETEIDKLVQTIAQQNSHNFSLTQNRTTTGQATLGSLTFFNSSGRTHQDATAPTSSNLTRLGATQK